MNCFVLIRKKHTITQAKKGEVIKGREKTKSRILFIRKIHGKDSKIFSKSSFKDIKFNLFNMDSEIILEFENLKIN